jgi:hypothetical protein
MCDYSLENVASRPATVADRLVSTTFQGTFTRGFAGADDLGTAVCLRPGTEIAFESAPRYEDPLTHADQSASGTVARFRQVNLQAPCTHHDALEFADGSIVLVARLVPGQRATVLQLPIDPERAASEPAKQEVEPVRV